MASTGFDPQTALGASLASLNLLEQSTDDVFIEGANLNQDVDPDGSTTDVVDIYWRIPGRPGLFTSRVPFAVNWTAIAFFYIGVKQALVRGIYDGLPDKNALPSGPAPTPLVPLGPVGIF